VYLVVVAVPAGATTIKSASGYGPFDSNFANCFSSSSNCEAFQATGQTLVVNGNTENILQLGGNGSSLDIFDFGAVQASTVISLPFQSWGMLTCGNGFGSGAVSSAFDSSGPSSTVPGLPCTPIDDVSGTGTSVLGGTLYSTTDALGNSVGFTILGDGSIQFDSSFTDAAFWFTPDSSTATPEPASLALLGTGLSVIIGSKLRRRKRA